MEHAREIIKQVICERTSTEECDKLETSGAFGQAELFLGTGLSTAVHIFLGHEGCKATEASRCEANRQVEVWIFKVSSQLEVENEQPAMLPMFLKNAIRSQLYFSPVKSWLSSDAHRGFRCVYRVSTSPYFDSGPNEVETHSFPIYKALVDNKTVCLSVQLKWLKKDHFPEALPKCLSNRLENDQWVFPFASDVERMLPAAIPTSVKRTLSRQNSKEVVVPMQVASTPMDGGGITAEDRQLSLDCQSKENLCNQLLCCKGADDVSPSKTEELLNAEFEERSPRSKKPKAFEGLSLENNKDRPLPIRFAGDGAFHPKTKLPLNSSPAPLNRTPGRKKVISDDKGRGHDASIVERQRRVTLTSNNNSSGLLCNFEESVLNGRLEPTSSVNGFKLQVAVTGTFPSPHLTLPVTTFYFNDNISDTDAPSSLYMGHCNLSSLGRKALLIPKRCTLQAVLFNPQGSIVKIFLVGVDVTDMPPCSKTFIRQRTFAVPNGSNVETVSGEEGKLKGKSVLKFLIHLRLASDSRSRVYLHSDIRMLLSNKGSDLEGLERFAVTCGLKSTTQTQMPQHPKYSPTK